MTFHIDLQFFRFISQQQKAIAGIVFVEAARLLRLKKSTPDILGTFSPPPEWVLAAMVSGDKMIS